MLTKTGFTNILNNMFDEIELNDTQEQLLGRLIDDFDDKNAVLRKYGTVNDDEGVEEYDYIDNSETDTDKYDALAKRYSDLQRKYKERFFGIVKDTEDKQVEDIKRDGTEQTFEDLFKNKEA